MILEANETMKSDITIQDSWRRKLFRGITLCTNL